MEFRFLAEMIGEKILIFTATRFLLNISLTVSFTPMQLL